MRTVTVALDRDAAQAEFVDDHGVPHRLWVEPAPGGWAVVGTDGLLSAHPSRLTAVMAWTAAIGERIDDHAERLGEG